MKKRVKELIEQYDSIVIHRHTRPDMDAIGSQMGLFHLIKTNYPQKQLYVVGDENNLLYKTKMDVISDDIFKDSLSIIIDVAVKALVSDTRYLLAKDVLVIDHHRNDCDIENVTYFYQLSDFSSACEMLSDLARELDLEVSSEAATYIYGGMVTDTGRFQYITNDNASRVFLNASFITQFNPDIQNMYDFLYTEDLKSRVTKDMFRSFELTSNNVAYRKNTLEIIEKSGLDFFSVSRGMVNLMAGIKEIPIWASFTYDAKNDKVVAEIRSRGITVVDIATKYGGGGHNNACGATLESFEQADLLINDLNERAKQI